MLNLKSTVCFMTKGAWKKKKKSDLGVPAVPQWVKDLAQIQYLAWELPNIGVKKKKIRLS